MPTLHKLRVFRGRFSGGQILTELDDIVFLIYLYQRWIYPVDTNRVEVGTEFADVDASELELFKKKLEEEKQQGQKKSVVSDNKTAKSNTADKKDQPKKPKVE